MQIFLIFAFYYITSTTALTTPNAASIPSGNNLAPPPPVAGESVDQWLTQLFGPVDDVSSNSTNSTLSARSHAHARRDTTYLGDYREYNGIHELSWDNETARTSYNLTMDLSNSCIGLNLSSEIGTYTFTNGTTTAETKLEDIISDVWSLAPTPADRRRRWANHTATLAQIALDEANQVLNCCLICQNYTATQVLAKVASGTSDLNPVHDELRHLLSSSWSYWTATLVSTFIGAAIGASLAAGVQHHFSGNITAQNVVQTAAVVGATVLIGGILMRLHENGRLDRAAQIANNRAQLGRDAVLQNAHIARWRETFAEARRQSTDRAWDAAASRDAGGFSIDGQTSPGSVMGGVSAPETPGRSSGQYLCLSDREAVDAMRALGEMSSDEMRLKMMATIHEVEMERMERGLSTPRTSDLQQLCRPLNSAGPSFKTTKDFVEASAADLVELGNIASGSGGGFGGGDDGGYFGEGGNADSGGGKGGGGGGSGGGDDGGAIDSKGKGKATDGGGGGVGSGGATNSKGKGKATGGDR